MGLGSTIGFTGLTSIILVIAILVIGVNYLYNRYMEIFQIDFLWNNGFCNVIDDNGNRIVDGITIIDRLKYLFYGKDDKKKSYDDDEEDEDDKRKYLFYGKDSVYSREFCAFNPLMLTDKNFRESATALYDKDKMFKGIKRIINGTWVLPNRDLINKDPVLFSMILNPWYIRDDVFYTKQKIQYTFDLRTFIIDGVEFSNFTDRGGVYHSSYTNVINANSSTRVDCSDDITDVITCRDNPGICPCSVQNVPIHYLYIDSTLLVELPAQFYLGKIPDSQTKRVKVKIYGKEKELDIKPLRIETLKDMEDLVFTRFYDFEQKMRVDNFSCDDLIAADQKKYDSRCKFFESNALAGLIVALRRLIIINIPESVRDDWIKKVDDLNNRGQQLNYFEFFLWLAAKSHRDKITYEFKAFNPNSR